MSKGTREELAYLAGLFDGEGYIGATSSRNHGWRMDYLRVIIKMCDEEGIELAHRLFGGTPRWIPAKPPRRAQLQWRLTGRSKIEAFIEAMMPFCRIKTPQLRLAKEFTTTFSGWNRPGTLRGSRACANGVPKQIVEKRQAIILQLKEAKRA